MKPIKFSLVTPERKLLEEEVMQATLPTEAGEVTILPDHIPYIATLKPGEILTKNAKGETRSFVVSGGFVEFHDNTISILADAAERADEIDPERARAAEARAREIREKKLDVSAEEQALAVAALERAWARLHVAKKHHSRSGAHPETSE
jgi:F-type H+-transporting ATPase subunit epsilon